MIRKKLVYFNNLRKSELGLRFQRGVIWNTVGIFLSRFLLVIASIIVARVLGKETYGKLGIIQSTIGMFGVFAGLGLGITSTKYLAEFKLTDAAKAGRIISLTNIIALVGSGFVSILLFIFAPIIAKDTLAAPELSIYLRISSILLFFSTINGVQIGILTGLEKFKEISKINILNGALNFLLLITGSYFFLLMGAVWALSISIVITFLLSQLLVRRELKKFNITLDYSNCWTEKNVIWKFSIPAFLAGTLVGPVNWICNSILVNQNNGYAEMGVYNAANQWFSILLFFPGIISNTILPILTEKVALNEKERTSRILKYSIFLNGILVLPVILFFILFSTFIMNLYGKGFGGNEFVLIYTLIAAGLFAIQNPVGNLIAASGKMWVGFGFNLLWGLVFISFTYSYSNFGAAGIAMSRLIAYMLLLILTLSFAIPILVNKKNKIS
ncbi:MAG TPA: hypothetical protein DHV28_15220 [Ignavibacteriales bacterium]|nr:hypothetical protein [Ignavibacteriales bacterium]